MARGLRPFDRSHHWRNAVKKLIICAVVAALVAGCTSGRTLTPAQTAYMERVNATPLLFIIAPAMQPQAWARALDFLSRFSHLRLRVSGETRIETDRKSVV